MDPDALQPHVQPKGGDRGGSFYRNEYNVVDDKGRVITSTYKILRWNSDGSDVMPGQTSVVRSHASALNEELDVVTGKIVRYIESVKGCRVLKINAEYVVDEASSVWLAWLSDAAIVSGVGASDFRNAETLHRPEREGERERKDRSPSPPRRLVAKQGVSNAALEVDAKALDRQINYAVKGIQRFEEELDAEEAKLRAGESSTLTATVEEDDEWAIEGSETEAKKMMMSSSTVQDAASVLPPKQRGREYSSDLFFMIASLLKVPLSMVCLLFNLTFVPNDMTPQKFPSLMSCEIQLQNSAAREEAIPIPSSAKVTIATSSSRSRKLWQVRIRQKETGGRTTGRSRACQREEEGTPQRA